MQGLPKPHMASVNWEGEWTKITFQKFDDGDNDDAIFNLESFENDETEETEDKVEQIEDFAIKSDFVDPLSYVSLKPPSCSFDRFIFVKLLVNT